MPARQRVALLYGRCCLPMEINVKKLFSSNIFCMGRVTHRKPQKSFLLSCRTCQRFSGIVICISASPYNQRGFYVVAYYVKLVGTRSPPRVQLAVWFKFIVLPVRCYLHGFAKSISFTWSTALILTGCCYQRINRRLRDFR
jgi:hypothetical protein